MRKGIWVRTLNVLNLKYERLVHNSAKVVPLQVFGKFSLLHGLLLPYYSEERQSFALRDDLPCLVHKSTKETSFRETKTR